MIFAAGHSSTRPRKYLYIDGGYFQRTCTYFNKNLELSSDVFPSIKLLSSGYDRVFYYDSLPTRRRKQTDTEFYDEYDRKARYLNSIRAVPNCHVRDGFSRFREWRGLEQKGVDTWIAIEVLLQAYNGNNDIAEIITGDLDLYPLFEALVQTRVKGVLRYETSTISDDLILAADEAKPLTSVDYIGWLEIIEKGGLWVNQSPNARGQHWKAYEVAQTKYGTVTINRSDDAQEYYAVFDGIGNVFGSNSSCLIEDQVRKFVGDGLLMFSKL